MNRHIEMVSESVTEQLNQIKREWTETTSKTITTHTGGAGMATKIIIIIYFLDTRSSPDNIVHENGVLSFI